MNADMLIRQSLFAIERALKSSSLWQPSAPDEAAFASQEPFCIDTMVAEQWLQWVFLPRMHALLDGGAPLPARLAILPYFEVAFDGRSDDVGELLMQLRALDALFEG
ncbi:YqcC family protein [Dickeya poaceiphila]|uniref:YqcC family protein n=1 Tax=Dickeya poaceiphila TaxID=568768 RepID=A0A5B8I940_9GAMM|nr:YqcC family protein [Dickeya poaceiphila]QDX30884.1 YqcC family protein [Dickeya poaceiphila]